VRRAVSVGPLLIGSARAICAPVTRRTWDGSRRAALGFSEPRRGVGALARGGAMITLQVMRTGLVPAALVVRRQVDAAADWIFVAFAGA